MIVCVCKAVSDRRIRAAVADGATRLQHISRQTGLGTCCGKCLSEAKSVLAGCLAANAALPHNDSAAGFFSATAANVA